MKTIVFTKKSFTGYLLLLLAYFTLGCDDDKGGDIAVPAETFTYMFDSGPEGWEGGFADYPKDWDTARFEFVYQHADLPAEVNSSGKSMLISGRNISDDLFMFMKKQITGLEPNKTYKATFVVELASMYLEKSVGIGGSPGGSVYLKAGGTTTEPMPVVVEDDVRMNIDKGGQSLGGKDMVKLGTIGIAGDESKYTLIQRDNKQNPVSITTDGNGSLWVIIGTDSGFEGTTRLYYNTIEVKLAP
ncbi:hypothetical protein ACXYMU_11220 [Pontibacter sp. CAU 1760]